MDVENIGRFLLKLRKENNLTQKEIATLCNISAQAVSKWERGVSIPDIELLERLSVLYRISINEIISGEKRNIYIDIDKRRGIVNLTASTIVFIAYFFNFVTSDLDGFGYNYILKGYQLIFNGTGGFIVYLSWVVFIILISHLIIRIYLLAKILDYTSNLHNFLIASMSIVIIISFISIFSSIFFVFPQLIILIAIIVQFLNNKDLDFEKSEESKNMTEYRQNYKNKDINPELLLDKKNLDSKFLKYTKIIVFIGIFVCYFIAFVILSDLIQITINDYSVNDYVLTKMFSLEIFMLILSTYVLKMYKYIGSFNTKKVFIRLGITFAIVPIFIIAFINFEYSISDSIQNLIAIITLVHVTITSILLFIASYRIN